MRSMFRAAQRAFTVAVGVSPVAWSMGCMNLAGGSSEPEDLPAGLDAVVEDSSSYGDGTTLWGTWSGTVTCPSVTGTFDVELAEVGAWTFGGPATIDTGDEVELELVVSYDGDEGVLRDVGIEVTACETCPRFEDVTWDLETLPAVIEGEIHDLMPAEVCGFDLHAT